MLKEDTKLGAWTHAPSKGEDVRTMVLIPAGTPHKWSEVEEFMSYTVVRVDPNRIVPLK
jgi:hypothetical protein